MIFKKVCLNQIQDDLIYLKQGDGILPLKNRRIG